MPSPEAVARMSSAKGVSASAISVVIIGTSRPAPLRILTSGGRFCFTCSGSTWPPLRTVMSTPSKPRSTAAFARSGPWTSARCLEKIETFSFGLAVAGVASSAAAPASMARRDSWLSLITLGYITRRRSLVPERDGGLDSGGPIRGHDGRYEDNHQDGGGDGGQGCRIVGR